MRGPRSSGSDLYNQFTAEIRRLVLYFTHFQSNLSKLLSISLGPRWESGFSFGEKVNRGGWKNAGLCSLIEGKLNSLHEFASLIGLNLHIDGATGTRLTT